MHTRVLHGQSYAHATSCHFVDRCLTRFSCERVNKGRGTKECFALRSLVCMRLQQPCLFGVFRLDQIAQFRLVRCSSLSKSCKSQYV